MCCLSCKRRVCTSRRLKKVLVSFIILGCTDSSVVY
uniref:Similar to EBS1 (EMS-MUTAGENIZED BRI1 SUPPRESSOR 1) n=1 Tax=Arundo donax TaxID=35708 RepID=A0A0A9G3Q7_ARUDO